MPPICFARVDAEGPMIDATQLVPGLPPLQLPVRQLTEHRWRFTSASTPKTCALHFFLPPSRPSPFFVTATARRLAAGSPKALREWY